jgi:rubredoxin
MPPKYIHLVIPRSIDQKRHMVDFAPHELCIFIPFPVILDYDGDDNECPVCGDDLPENAPCEQCGYSYDEDNGLDSAVNHYSI